MNCDVIVIGAGASGLAAAIEAGRRGLKVTVLEHLDKPLKKILATGNGKCNFTNKIIDGESFRGNRASFAYEALKQFGPESVKAAFEDFGVLTLERDGYMYPANEQARTVRNALLSMAERAGVRIVPGSKVLSAKCAKENVGNDGLKFTVKCEDHEYRSKSLVLATGGCAGENLGSDGSGYELAKGFGHTVITPRPALCPLILGKDKKTADKLAGVRAKARARLLFMEEVKADFRGEIIFNKLGISGIPVMQLSRYYDGRAGFSLSLDFLPDMSEDEVFSFLKKTRDKRKESSCFDGFDGLVNNKLASEIMLRAGIKGDTPIESVTDSALEAFAKILKDLRMEVTGTGSHSSAQVTAGGVSTEETDEKTMESKLVKGLYIVGELLDIDGNCGGYNLQWAFTSGVIAGRSCGA
ncbi:MAG: aminoacetone oxidase family FAD-binding enzyme [Lachnospiraceae bacterium]|nr:aminoacetone oxidase family FAD-binding enzyme [Lachnospiraceae bacterium]